MKGKFLLGLFLLLPVSLAGQAAKSTNSTAPIDFDRYEVFAGADYSGANQVKGSSALIGGDFGASAKLRKWFGGTVDFADFAQTATSHTQVSPTVTALLAGPEFYITSDKITGFLHVMFGGEHVGGIHGAKPDVAFAYAVGGGIEYTLTKHFAARVSGDGITSSYVLDPDNLGFSPHSHVNARASGGVAYRF